jgi:Tfp pilus assembly protein PilO
MVSRGRFLRRVVQERRGPFMILGLLLAINLVVYGAVVLPLARRVATVEDRDRAADRLLKEARAEHDKATRTLRSQEVVSRDLTRFYNEVLPQNWSDARRMTYLRLQQLAADSHLQFEEYKNEQEQEKGSSLTRVNIDLVLRGTYDAVRAFVYKLDTSPEFVVIDDIGLAEGADTADVLELTLKLSTYFRSAPQ